MHSRNGQQQQRGSQIRAEGEESCNEVQGGEDEGNEEERGLKTARRATATSRKIERMGNDSAVA